MTMTGMKIGVNSITKEGAMEGCPICGKVEKFHVCSAGKPARTVSTISNSRKRRGLIASLRLAFDILVGSFRLLWRYPILILPLVPLFLMVLALEVWLLLLPALVAWVMLFGLAYCLMFSFAITSHMLQRIDQKQNPEFWKAFGESITVPMTTSIF